MQNNSDHARQVVSLRLERPVEFEKFMNADPLTHVVVSFFSNNDGSTDVNLVHSGWGTSPDWDAAREYFKKAGESAFQQLEHTVNGN
jgi:hypothetical protein